MVHTRNTIWEKITYLKSCLGAFSARHIRYCADRAAHLIVNDRHRWAYLVYDQGTVAPEMAFEEVDYLKALEKYGAIFTTIEIEKKPKKTASKQPTYHPKSSKDETYYEFIQELVPLDQLPRLKSSGS